MVTALYLSDFSVRGYCPGKLAAWTRRPLFAAASESFCRIPAKIELVGDRGGAERITY